MKRPTPTASVALAASIVLVLGLTILFGVAGNRALEACSATPPGTPAERAAASVTYEWSFSPLGFICIYSTGGAAVDQEWVGIWP